MTLEVKAACSNFGDSLLVHIETLNARIRRLEVWAFANGANIEDEPVEHLAEAEAEAEPGEAEAEAEQPEPKMPYDMTREYYDVSLRTFGYKRDNSFEERHAALEKAVQEFGIDKVRRRINWLNATAPHTHFTDDLNGLRRVAPTQPYILLKSESMRPVNGPRPPRPGAWWN